MTQPERRTNAWDRRRVRTPAVSRYLFMGRRVGPRRDAESAFNYYVDRPPLEAWRSATLLLILSILDGLLSLFLFSSGVGREVNPLLDFMLGYGAVPFFVFKIGLTVFALFLLLIHWHFIVRFPWLKVTLLIRFLILFYLGLIAYEGSLFLN